MVDSYSRALRESRSSGCSQSIGLFSIFLETIKGKPFSLRTRENILRAGLIVIAAIFVLVMFNDISRNIEPIGRFFARLFGRG